MCSIFQVGVSRSDIEEAEEQALQQKTKEENEEGLFDMVHWQCFADFCGLKFSGPTKSLHCFCGKWEQVKLSNSAKASYFLTFVPPVSYLVFFSVCQDEDLSADLPSTPTVTAHPVAERLDSLMVVLMAYIKDVCIVNGSWTIVGLKFFWKVITGPKAN